MCHYWRKETGGGETATRINTWSRTYVRTDGRLKATAANSIKRTDGRAGVQRARQPATLPTHSNASHTHTHTHVVCGPGGPSFHRRTFSLSVYNTERRRVHTLYVAGGQRHSVAQFDTALPSVRPSNTLASLSSSRDRVSLNRSDRHPPSSPPPSPSIVHVTFPSRSEAKRH